MTNEVRIGFTGGGTGGHIFPLLAVADEVIRIMRSQPQKPYRLYYFGNPGQFASEFAVRGMKVSKVGSSKLRRYMSLLNILDAIKFPFVCVQALVKMFFAMPDALFSKGGTGALPVVLAAWFFRIPVIIHDSDAVPGLTSTLSARFAKRIAVAFEKTLEYFPAGKTAVVGNPLRSDLLHNEETDLSGEQAKRILGFEPTTPVLLILGGSQGSKAINDFMLDNAKQLVRRCQILHQTGPNNFEEFKHEITLALADCIPEEKQRYKLVPFLKQDLKQAYEACDIIISRAGNATIFEMAYFGKPAILIPLPDSAQNHQYYNASAYAGRGAAIVVEQENLSPAVFFAQLEKILGSAETYAGMREAAFSFQTPHAAQVIADEIIRLAME
jgi:UDP-N-acetylglucosamine--N-acetylmuramyl-(pentapeptide) pyrophosphoryl-undecaprenol N-acetylglucosamine transferase